MPMVNGLSKSSLFGPRSHRSSYAVVKHEYASLSDGKRLAV